MKRDLRRSAQAEEDILSIWLYVAQHSPSSADRLLDRCDARWRLLLDHPFAGPPRDDIAPGVRHLVVGDYLTLYRVTDDAIEILRVLHGKRDLSRAGIDDSGEDAT